MTKKKGQTEQVRKGSQLYNAMCVLHEQSAIQARIICDLHVQKVPRHQLCSILKLSPMQVAQQEAHGMRALVDILLADGDGFEDHARRKAEDAEREANEQKHIEPGKKSSVAG